MKSIIDISEGNYYLSFTANHLVLKTNNEIVAKIHKASIEAVIIHNPAVSYSQTLLVNFAKENIPLIICDEYHLPIAQMFYFNNKYTQGERMNWQLATSTAKKNGIWKEIVKLKIKEQANLLKHIKHYNYKRLENIAKAVTTADKSNSEGNAAAIYFKSLFGEEFKREQMLGATINAFLNYGYIIMRSSIARAILVAGLNPSLGIFHANTHNPFCLVDDLIEPFRISIDALCYQHYATFSSASTITPAHKSILSSVLQSSVMLNKQEIILSDAIQKFVYSYIDTLESSNSRVKLNFPESFSY